MRQIPRVYCENEVTLNEIVSLSERETHHLFRVMRAELGDPAILFTPDGCEFLARIHDVSQECLLLRVMERHEVSQKSWRMTLVQAIPKSGNMDWIIEKATELGVDEVFPVITARVVKKSSKIDRWKKIAIAASQQCRRSDIPKIHEVKTWDCFLSEFKDFDLALIPTLDRTDRLTLDQALKESPQAKRILVAIGPEGDFTSQELVQVLDLGWKSIDLGPLILRVETAAIASLALLGNVLRGREVRFINF